MFVSPCTLRSTQCAALIALAAAAGIARVEATGANKPSEEGSRNISLLSLRSATKTNAFELAANVSAPWLNRVAAFAVWCLGGKVPDSSCLSYARAESNDGPAPAVAVLAHNGTSTAVPPAQAALPRHSSHLIPLGRVPYFFPFAVGPPFRSCHLPPNAVGTYVPGDSTANGCSVPKVAAPDEDSSDARLARLSGPGHALAGPAFFPGSACQRRSELHTHDSAAPAGARWDSGTPFHA